MQPLYDRLFAERLAWLKRQEDVRDFYPNKRILVTGGTGFIGTQVVKFLNELGAQVCVPLHKVYDLRNQHDTFFLFRLHQPFDVVFHLAAGWMGIGRTSQNPAKSFYDNLQMGVNLIDTCMQYDNTKIVLAGSVCAYPEYTPVPYREHNLWAGKPEPTNGPYGIAKRALLEMLQAYHTQYGLPGAYLLLGNTYGPGDNFDLTTSHVIPALVRKLTEAKVNKHGELVVWGTGQVSRDFTYVTDTASALVVAGVRLHKPDPINIGSGSEVFIAWLVKRLVELIHFEGEIVYDKTKPEGQKRRGLCIDLAKQTMQWEPQVSLDDGLASTLYWYFDQMYMEGAYARLCNDL